MEKMMKFWLCTAMVALVLAGLPAVASAVDGEDAVDPDADSRPAHVLPVGNGIAVVGATLSAALAAFAGALGIGRIGRAIVESIARQPEATGSMFAPMVISAAMIEGASLFAIVVCMLAVLRIS